ncbi:hypothetical protein [Kitasatospora purpeofusca]|uniref:hypothetical protein n=1 Tax=Kitasatospora purpeofusca TaxID=67352 RepID=UPI00225A127D|nr:hypothetical protein [Kitasatospora purpeofusca]MCX4753598.1 hypothetical protein [Kitasatospora purpeofusca]WSR37277.1 hypothetical protein OG715_20085 [Kitasatospora purpeofusca]WSR45516.1 hypothetical protein OG196_19815 [Kitasatospora purpeofusca]
MQPVLDFWDTDGFELWPVAEVDPYLTLHGRLAPAEVGTAVMRIVGFNDLDPEPRERPRRPPRPREPLDSFLHGLLTFDSLYAAGGLRVTDSITGTTFLPGCCAGIGEWRDWFGVLDDGGATWFGHNPVAQVERAGDTVRLLLDAELDDGPVIELPAAEARRLLAGVERDLTAFHALAAEWAALHLPDHAGPVTAALADALDL